MGYLIWLFFFWPVMVAGIIWEQVELAWVTGRVLGTSIYGAIK